MNRRVAIGAALTAAALRTRVARAADREIEILVDHWRKSKDLTLKVADAMPPENYAYKPFDRVYISTDTGGNLSVLFTTYTSAASNGPVVMSVLNNSSQNPDGFPNSGIAPSSIFVIIGSGLADLKDPVLQSSADPGLPNTLNGASITITAGAVILHPAIYYTSPKQIAAVMPANAPLGVANLTVTYNGSTSAAFQIHIVSSAVGINRYDGNVAVATDAITGALISFISPAKPGEILVLWTTGLGIGPLR